MSAFVVSQEHIAALVVQERDWYWYWNGEAHRDNRQQIGQMLWDENHRSVNYRYQEETPNRLYLHDRVEEPLSAVARLKLLNCYEYQTCEHPEWESSKAYAYCQALRDHLINELPGYDSAEWAI